MTAPGFKPGPKPSLTPGFTVYLRGVGLLGPGLTDWAAGRAMLADPATWQPSPTVLSAPARLPPAERRRAGDIVKLSLAVSDQACRDTGIDTRTLATVFTASSGDANNCHALCETLATAERAVSPTRFTNSVHNAAAGYWHIATASQAASTSLCAFDASFGAGLIEAAAQCLFGRQPVLLVSADVPYPEPLHSVRPIGDAIGLALLIGAEPGGHDVARLALRFGDAPAHRCDTPALEALRLSAPAGRGLPLLQVIARAAAQTVVLEYVDGVTLSLDVTAGASR